MDEKERYRLSDVFLLALRIEKNGYAFYTDLASSTLKSDLKKVFTFLAKEESEHIDLFKQLYDTCRQQMVESGTSIGENIFQLDRMASQHIFLRTTFEEVKRKAKTIEDAITCALSFEDDTIKFFSLLLASVDVRYQEIIRALIVKEESHKTTLQNLLANPAQLNT